MLNLFTSYCLNQADLKAPKIKYPMLYNVTKDGLSHTLLGTNHEVPLSVYPDYVMPYLDKSTLLTECIVELSREQLECHNLINYNGNYLLDKMGVYEDQLNANLKEVFNQIGLKAEPYEVSTYALCDLYTQAGNGVDLNLLHQFQNEGKKVIPLNDITDIIKDRWCMLYERKYSEVSYGQTHAKQLKSIYEKTINWHPNQLQFIDHFLNHQGSTKDLDQVPDDFINTYLLPQNKQWADILDQAHTLGQSCLLACGSYHLLGEDSLIAHLLSKGYTVEPVKSENQRVNNLTEKLTDLRLCL